MNGTRWVLALVAAITLAAAQPMQGQHDDIDFNDHTRADRKVVDYALTSPERAWKFITSPEATYPERRAVAREAAKSLPLSYLPLVQAASSELRGTWGMLHPEGSSFSQHEGPSGSTMVLGHVYDYPKTRIAYPKTFEERSRAPWPWQTALAMQDVWYGMVRGRRSDELYAYARALPCKSKDDVAFFVRVSAGVAEQRREVPPADILGAWINLVRRSDASSQSFTGWGLRMIDEDSWWAAHLLFLEEARHDQVNQAASGLDDLTRRLNSSNLGSVQQGNVPYTVILEIGRRVVSKPEIRLYERANAGLRSASVFGVTIAPHGNTVDHARLETIVAKFVEWFRAHEKQLEAGAAAEEKAMAAASQRFDTTLCR